MIEEIFRYLVFDKEYNQKYSVFVIKCFINGLNYISRVFFIRGTGVKEMRKHIAYKNNIHLHNTHVYYATLTNTEINELNQKVLESSTKKEKVSLVNFEIGSIIYTNFAKTQK